MRLDRRACASAAAEVGVVGLDLARYRRGVGETRVLAAEVLGRVEAQAERVASVMFWWISL